MSCDSTTLSRDKLPQLKLEKIIQLLGVEESLYLTFFASIEKCQDSLLAKKLFFQRRLDDLKKEIIESLTLDSTLQQEAIEQAIRDYYKSLRDLTGSLDYQNMKTAYRKDEKQSVSNVATNLTYLEKFYRGLFKSNNFTSLLKAVLAANSVDSQIFKADIDKDKASKPTPTASISQKSKPSASKKKVKDSPTTTPLRDNEIKKKTKSHLKRSSKAANVNSKERKLKSPQKKRKIISSVTVTITDNSSTFFSKNRANTPSLVSKLDKYLENRIKRTKRQYIIPFLSWFFGGKSLQKKINAVNALKDAINTPNKPSHELHDHLSVLRDGKLGKTIRKHLNCKKHLRFLKQPLGIMLNA